VTQRRSLRQGAQLHRPPHLLGWALRGSGDRWGPQASSTSTGKGKGAAMSGYGQTPQLGVAYNCGNCGAEILLKPGDVIQCRQCGYRILYKKRTRRVVQFEAR
jgi:DNA-directed RNA polymerase I, II, and III subunit RPABC4